MGRVTYAINLQENKGLKEESFLKKEMQKAPDME